MATAPGPAGPLSLESMLVLWSGLCLEGAGLSFCWEGPHSFMAGPPTSRLPSCGQQRSPRGWESFCGSWSQVGSSAVPICLRGHAGVQGCPVVLKQREEREQVQCEGPPLTSLPASSSAHLPPLLATGHGLKAAPSMSLPCSTVPPELSLLEMALDLDMARLFHFAYCNSLLVSPMPIQ